MATMTPREDPAGAVCAVTSHQSQTTQSQLPSHKSTLLHPRARGQTDWRVPLHMGQRWRESGTVPRSHLENDFVVELRASSHNPAAVHPAHVSSYRAQGKHLTSPAYALNLEKRSTGGPGLWAAALACPKAKDAQGEPRGDGRKEDKRALLSELETESKESTSSLLWESALFLT